MDKTLNINYSVTGHKCGIGISSIFDTVFRYFPFFLTVLRYWVLSNAPPPPGYTDVSFLCSRAQVFKTYQCLVYFQDTLNADYFVCGFSVSDLNCNARPPSNFHLFSCFVEVILNCYTKTNIPFSSSC